jgi:type I restriction enzyme, R subunit
VRTTALAQHLAAYLRQTDPLAKTIVFCVDQLHAENMRQALEQACAEYVMR